MKYFTKELYESNQLPQEVTPREDEKVFHERDRLWDIAVQEYKAHIEAISDVLPKSAKQLLNYGFHDSMIIPVVQHKNTSLCLGLDTSHVPWIEGDRYWLTFSQGTFLEGTGVKDETYWLYDEIHLSEHAQFEVHVLCQTPDLQMSELQIAANDLKIERKA